MAESDVEMGMVIIVGEGATIPGGISV